MQTRFSSRKSCVKFTKHGLGERKNERFASQQLRAGGCVRVGPLPRHPRSSFAARFYRFMRSIKLSWGPPLDGAGDTRRRAELLRSRASITRSEKPAKANREERESKKEKSAGDSWSASGSRRNALATACFASYWFCATGIHG